jgi:hypothetical protein
MIDVVVGNKHGLHQFQGDIHAFQPFFDGTRTDSGINQDAIHGSTDKVTITTTSTCEADKTKSVQREKNLKI